MRTAIAVLIGIACASPLAAQEKGLSPQQIGEIFCLGRLSGDMAPVLALTTPVLASAIAHAEARNDVIQRAAPDEKPPLGDGVPWQSYPDYAPECSVGEVVTSATMTGIEIRYGFPQEPDADFTDTLVLVPEPSEQASSPRLRIDDVVYGASGSLAETLQSLFEP